MDEIKRVAHLMQLAYRETKTMPEAITKVLLTLGKADADICAAMWHAIDAYHRHDYREPE